MTLPRPVLIGGVIVALVIAVYATFQLGANQQSGPSVDTTALEAVRKGDMKKLIFTSTPAAPVTTGFTDAAANPKSFADYQGKFVLVNFWATWCAPCRHEMPSLNKLQTELGGDDFEVVTIATGHNPLPAIKTFFNKAAITDLPILLDPKQELARKMSVFGLPATIILDREGREIARLRGDAEWADENAFAIINALIASETS